MLITFWISSFIDNSPKPFHKLLDAINGNCFTNAVFWKSNLSFNCFPTKYVISFTFSINLSDNILFFNSNFSCSLENLPCFSNSSISFSTFFLTSIAILGKLILVNEIFPRPRLVFSPFTFSKTLVLHPIVAISYLYLSGSSAFHFSCLLNSVSKNTKFGNNLRLVVLQANNNKSKFGVLNLYFSEKLGLSISSKISSLFSNANW